jgi:hypothetical protein
VSRRTRKTQPRAESAREVFERLVREDHCLHGWAADVTATFEWERARRRLEWLASLDANQVSRLIDRGRLTAEDVAAWHVASATLRMELLFGARDARPFCAIPFPDGRR